MAFLNDQGQVAYVSTPVSAMDDQGAISSLVGQGEGDFAVPLPDTSLSESLFNSTAMLWGMTS